MPARRKPIALLAPTALTKNLIRNAVKGRFDQPDYPVVLMDEPPSDLEHDEIASRYWKDIAPMLNEQRVMTLADVTSFAMYCQVLADLERDRNAVALEGRTHMDDKGVLRKHPLIAVIADNRRLAASLAQQFGLTPASRSKAIPAPEDKTVTSVFAQD